VLTVEWFVLRAHHVFRGDGVIVRSHGRVHIQTCMYVCGFVQIPEDSHLVLRSSVASTSLECVKIVSESWFVCGAQDGSLGMYHASKKKPISMVTRAHGDGPTPMSGAVLQCFCCCVS
jgi:hypothetical protein